VPAGSGGLHHRLRGVRVRCADPLLLQRRERARGLSRAGLESWAADHPDEVICNFGFRIGPSSPIAAVVNYVPCNNGPNAGPTPAPLNAPQPTQAQIRRAASLIAQMNYTDYARQFLYPSTSLMIKSGLWIELEVIIGFVVALGLDR